VYSCETRLSITFLGPGGHFRRSYDEKGPPKNKEHASVKKYAWTKMHEYHWIAAGSGGRRLTAGVPYDVMDAAAHVSIVHAAARLLGGLLKKRLYASWLSCADDAAPAATYMPPHDGAFPALCQNSAGNDSYRAWATACRRACRRHRRRLCEQLQHRRRAG
jgi:hypothetical protein